MTRLSFYGHKTSLHHHMALSCSPLPVLPQTPCRTSKHYPHSLFPSLERKSLEGISVSFSTDNSSIGPSLSACTASVKCAQFLFFLTVSPIPLMAKLGLMTTWSLNNYEIFATRSTTYFSCSSLMRQIGVILQEPTHSSCP